MLMRPLALAALAIVGAACSGSTTTLPKDGGASDAVQDSSSPISNTQACMDRATAECALISKCRPSAIQTNYGTVAACVLGVQTNCENALSAPSNGNTATATEACANAYPTWSCADFENNVNIPTACKQQTGTLASTASCAFPGQCESGFCAIPPNTQCGVCADPPMAGASCANLTTCGPGLVCAATTKICTTYVASGGGCGTGAPCGYQLSCVGAVAKTMTQGTCQAAVETVGAACDSTLTTGPGCDLGAGLTCNTTSETCAKASIAATGKPCGTVDDQQALCSAGGACTATSGTAGTCIAAAADGEACDDDGGTGCLSPERCISSEDGGASGKCEFASAATCK